LAIERVSTLAGGIVRDDWHAAAVNQLLAQGIAVISGVGQTENRRQITDELGRNRRIAAMAGTNDQSPGSPLFVNGRMDFGGAAPA
jgi:hypothetical protein